MSAWSGSHDPPLVPQRQVGIEVRRLPQDNPLLLPPGPRPGREPVLPPRMRPLLQVVTSGWLVGPEHHVRGFGTFAASAPYRLFGASPSAGPSQPPSQDPCQADGSARDAGPLPHASSWRAPLRSARRAVLGCPRSRLPRHWLDGTMPNRVTNQSLFPMLMVCILNSRAPFINIALSATPLLGPCPQPWETHQSKGVGDKPVRNPPLETGQSGRRERPSRK